MSDQVRALVWRFYNAKRFGAPRILALALSDEADDRGGGISESMTNLALKTEQSRAAVQRQMRRLELSGLLQCEEKSAGGPGQFHQYRLNLSLFFDHSNSNPRMPLTATLGGGSEASNSNSGLPLAEVTINTNKDYVEDSANGAPDDIEDRRLAGWIFELVRKLNPNHRPPPWKAWQRELRLMRERDGRTRHQIAALFKWANNDPFWRLNILSPSKLRKQWDQLEVKRMASGAPALARVQTDEGRCCWTKGGECKQPPVVRLPDGRELCRQHREEEEHERASAQA